LVVLRAPESFFNDSGLVDIALVYILEAMHFHRSAEGFASVGGRFTARAHFFRNISRNVPKCAKNGTNRKYTS